MVNLFRKYVKDAIYCTFHCIPFRICFNVLVVSFLSLSRLISHLKVPRSLAVINFSVLQQLCNILQMLCKKYRFSLNVVIRLLHTTLCLGIATSLLVNDSTLRRKLILGEDVSYGFMFLALLSFSLGMYHTAWLVGPGFVPLHTKKSRVNNNTDEERDAESSSMLPKLTLRECGFCGVEQPMRARHCEECGRCVHKYDHHCPWLETCVGEANHKYFWLFLTSTAVLVVWTLSLVWGAMIPSLQLSVWLRNNWVFILDISILVCGGMTVVILACLHSYLIVANVTTWELLSRHRITYLKYLDQDFNPFHQGFCKNVIIVFLCSSEPRRWDALYIKQAEMQTTVA